MKPSLMHLFKHKHPADCEPHAHLYSTHGYKLEFRLNRKYGHQEVSRKVKTDEMENQRYVKNLQGTLICDSTDGFSVWPKAFLAAGYQSYIGLTEGALDGDCDSFVLFVTGFFYHLLMHRRNYTDRIFTLQEAVVAAAAMDTHYDCGTKVFRYYKSAKN